MANKNELRKSEEMVRNKQWILIIRSFMNLYESFMNKKREENKTIGEQKCNTWIVQVETKNAREKYIQPLKKYSKSIRYRGEYWESILIKTPRKQLWLQQKE